MNAATYFINSSACICISYLLFILLRRETCFLQQRIFLMASVLLSFFLPFTHPIIPFGGKSADITAYSHLQASALSRMPEVRTGENSFIRLTFIIYISVVCVQILAVLSQLLRIVWLYSKSRRSTDGNFIILRSKMIKSPFSFFRWIFIPAEIKNEEDLRNICIHESIHSRQLHSLDNIIIGISCALMWFNPFMWLIKKNLHLVHEYMADDGTLNNGAEKMRYQALLVNQAAGSKLISIPSGFNNLLKKRMIMMTKSNTKDSRNARILSVIPLPLLLLITVSVINGLLPAEMKAQKQDIKKDSLKEVVVVGYGQQKQTTCSSGKDTINYIVDGVKVSDINSINPDSIESVNVLKDDRTVIVRTKGFARRNQKNGMIDTRPIEKPDKIVYILDGREINYEEFKNIPPEAIESVGVIKEYKDQIRKYTSKDCDGVVIVTTKK